MTAAATPKDQARDLEADLAICEAATSAPSSNPGCTECHGAGRVEICHDPYGTLPCFTCYMVDLEHAGEFAAAACKGWPYAIRRAMEAEKEIDRLHNELQIQQEQRSRSERLIYQEQRNGGGGCGD